MTPRTTILIAEPRSDQPPTPAGQLAAALASRLDVDVLRVPHLYDLPPERPIVRRLQAVAGDLIVVAAIYPRAARWLLDAYGVKAVPGRSIACLDLRRLADVPACLDAIANACGAGVPPAPAAETAAPQAGGTPAPQVPEELASPRWYPVIDHDRCVNCLECLNFCLFGVYGLDESGRIFVEEPDACRTGCPACARVCPASAIMFPMHADAAIAGGEGPAAAVPAAPDGLDRLVDALDETDV